MKVCVYYDKRTNKLIDILPNDTPPTLTQNIQRAWSQSIARSILIAISSEEKFNTSQLREKVGHSISTLHDTVKRLEDMGLLKTEIIYEGNKQRVIKPVILCVTKSPKHKAMLQKFFQGMWIDSKKTQKIIEFLNKSPDKYYTPEEIAVKTKIPVDEVELLLSNWDSQVTRTFSDFMKERPFEKKVLYKGRK